MALRERTVRTNPDDAAARLNLADARFAAGDRQALRKALTDAIVAGASSSELEGAIDHVVGLRVKVTLVAPRTLARSEGKAKRVQDRRNV